MESRRSPHHIGWEWGASYFLTLLAGRGGLLPSLGRADCVPPRKHGGSLGSVSSARQGHQTGSLLALPRGLTGGEGDL